MNLNVLDATQEHIQEDLQSMQESLEGLKSSLENDVTLSTQQEVVSLVKDIVSQMANIEATEGIQDLQEQLTTSNRLSPEILEGILSSFISLKLAYTDALIGASANQSLEKYEQITRKKGELDLLLSRLQSVDTYQIDPHAAVVEEDPVP